MTPPNQKPPPRTDMNAIEKLIEEVENGRAILTPRELVAAARAELTAMRDELERVNNGVKARFTAPIVCMCGSTKFKQSWIAENARLTGEGFIVLAVGLWGHHERQYPPDDIKAKLDEIHKRKIDLCDWVWVLDVGGYVGSSTKSEILYAQQLGKQVRYLSHEFPNYVEPADPLATQLAAQSARVQALEAAVKVKDDALRRACIAACNCMTKTPDPEYHAESCLYKTYRKALIFDAALSQEQATPRTG